MKTSLKKLCVMLLVFMLAVLLLFSGCSGSSGYSGSSGSSGKSSYDRDAEYVGSQFGRSSDDVKDSVGRLADAMK